MLMFTNAVMYNNRFHQIHAIAHDLFRLFEKLIADFEEQEAQDILATGLLDSDPEVFFSSLLFSSLLLFFS